VKIVIVSYHIPNAQGPAAARILQATCVGLIELGHELRVWSWQDSGPLEPPPAWCTWAPLQHEARALNRARSLIRPRDEAARAEIDLPDDAMVVADDPFSFPAVRHHARAVLTVHYLTELDAVVLRRPEPAFIQRIRAERRAVRQARPSVLLYSERVQRRLRNGVVVPVAAPLPDTPVPLVDAPVGACLADWRWPPNRRALTTLLRLWPEVKHELPAARLLLAGRGLDQVGQVPGVEVMGVVDDSREVLDRAAVLLFPCPNTSGPKVKTIEALSLGLPVVTTESGAEGVHPAARDGIVVADATGFVKASADLLRDWERRARIARAGRLGVQSHHAPLPAARARVDAILRLNRRAD
jgi:glycosyltransferase involved in cell wall biosynthesis